MNPAAILTLLSSLTEQVEALSMENDALKRENGVLRTRLGEAQTGTEVPG